jgi:predicted kinase
MNELKIPELSLVVLVGISGSGKSTFAKRVFKQTEVISSEKCRGMVADEENNQMAATDEFELLHYVASKRWQNGHLTVVDATNVQTEARRLLVQLAQKYHCLSVAIVLDVPEKICQARKEERLDRNFEKHVFGHQRSPLKRSIKNLKKEVLRKVHESVLGVMALESEAVDPRL